MLDLFIVSWVFPSIKKTSGTGLHEQGMTLSPKGSVTVSAGQFLLLDGPTQAHVFDISCATPLFVFIGTPVTITTRDILDVVAFSCGRNCMARYAPRVHGASLGANASLVTRAPCVPGVSRDGVVDWWMFSGASDTVYVLKCLGDGNCTCTGEMDAQLKDMGVPFPSSLPPDGCRRVLPDCFSIIAAVLSLLGIILSIVRAICAWKHNRWQRWSSLATPDLSTSQPR
jgi:hypothetical protein